MVTVREVPSVLPLPPSASVASIPVAAVPGYLCLNLHDTRGRFRNTHLTTTGIFYDNIVVGIAVLHPAHSSTILLLKRAAHVNAFASMYGLPGGKVASSDLSIKHAVVRELYEETSLRIRSVWAEFKPLLYRMEKVRKRVDGTNMIVQEMSHQLNFLVEVFGADNVALNTNEHSEAVWATEEEAVLLPMTDGMRHVVQNAFGCVRAAGRTLGANYGGEDTMVKPVDVDIKPEE